MPANPSFAADVPLSGRRRVPPSVFRAFPLARTVVLAATTCLLAATAHAQNYTLLKTFDEEGSPYAGLVQGTDGYLYGTTYTGGANGYGTVFKIDTSGSTITTLHNFNLTDGAQPVAGLVQGGDGYLYGTTYTGGANNEGTVFKIDTAGSKFTTLHSFGYTDGAGPYAGLIQGTDGYLYGTTSWGGANNYGTIFKIDTAGSAVTTLHSFAGSDGSTPYSALIQGSDGNLYGTTTGGGSSGWGTVFKIDTSGSTLTTLHSFAGSDGANPHASLAQGTDGYLYGTTTGGGTNNDGTIFKIDTSGSTFTLLHSFVSTDGAYPVAGLIQAIDGNLYGTTESGATNSWGTVFKIDTAGSTLTTLHSFAGSDGANPYASLIQAADGSLFGTTEQGGGSNYGTIFKMDTGGSTFTTLHNFGGSDGATPAARLIQDPNGNLYGTTYYGGAGGYGTVFKMNTSGSTFSILHSFANSDGAYPYAGLVQGNDGYLYGTTEWGGAGNCGFGCGTIFKIDTNGTTLTTLHSFGVPLPDGALPYAGLIQGTDGYLYGTTSWDGAYGYGTIFKIDTSGSTYTTLHDFNGSDGSAPYGGLVQASDGNLYGTTADGGNNGYGTIFKIDTGGTTLTTLHSFNSSDGAYPLSDLIQGTDGYLYGTTNGGGSKSQGTIFRIDTGGSTFTTLYSFNGSSDGANPVAGVIQAMDGNLYGTTAGGGPDYDGTIFRIDASGSTFTMLHYFDYGDGAGPYAALVQAADGRLYGTTSGGGPGAGGVVFHLCPPPIAVASGSAAICAGSSTPLSGSGGVSCSWAPATGLSDPNSCSPSAHPSSTTTYTLTVTDANGCVSVNGPAVTVTVNPLPIAVASGSAAICAGRSTPLSGSGGVSCAWSPATGLSDPNLCNPSASPTSTTTYRLTVTDAYGCVSTNDPTVKVTVNPIPPAPAITAPSSAIVGATGIAASVVSHAGSTYAWTLTGGTITTGQGSSSIVLAAGPPGTTMLLSVTETSAAGCSSPAGTAKVQVDFLDMPPSDPFHDFVDAIARDSITAGCGNGDYCPGNSVTRAQMAVFLLKGKHGASYTPPPATGTVFADVPANAFAAAWIEELYLEEITDGCSASPLLYCPDEPVTRAQIAVFLLKAEHGLRYAPPACAGIFLDVECMPMPAFAVDWIEQLHAEGVTGGCGGGNYCPDDPSTRGQMAVFLVKTFNLP